MIHKALVLSKIILWSLQTPRWIEIQSRSYLIFLCFSYWLRQPKYPIILCVVITNSKASSRGTLNYHPNKIIWQWQDAADLPPIALMECDEFKNNVEDWLCTPIDSSFSLVCDDHFSKLKDKKTSQSHKLDYLTWQCSDNWQKLLFFYYQDNSTLLSSVS